MSSLKDQDTLFTLVGILLALFLGSLDQTIVSTALPKIVADLHGVERYAWVATAYLLSSTVMVPIYGRLADTYSRKKIELWAIVLFLLGSFLCGLAGEFGPLPLLGDGMTQLIIFRAIQGIGGAGLFAMAFIIIADLFPPAVRGKYQGIVGSVFGISSVLGPLIGGFLTDQGGSIIPGIAGWRWIFYVNLPLGIVSLWFISARMPKLIPPGEKEGLNYLSALMLIVGLVPLVLALQLDKNRYPWDSPFTLTLLGAAVVILTLFTVRSLHSDNPVLDFSLFNNKVFSMANAALFVMGAAFMSLIIFLPLYVVNVVGVSATSAGISLIPLSLGVFFGSTISGQLVSRFGHYRLFMLGGGAIMFLGVILLSFMDETTSYGTVTLFMAICGLGAGPTMPLYPLAIQNAVDIRKVGQATSASQFFRQIGGAMGAALMGTVLALGISGMAAPAVTSSNATQGENHRSIEIRLTRSTSLPEAEVNNKLAASGAVRMQHPDGTMKEGERLNPSVIDGPARARFAQALTRIFHYVSIMVALGWVFTLFIPEIPLRKTLDTPPIME